VSDELQDQLPPQGCRTLPRYRQECLRLVVVPKRRLRDGLHSELASREAISAVPEIFRRYGASISGTRRRIKSANFADLVSGLKRLRSAPRAASRPIAIGCASNQAAFPKAVSVRRVLLPLPRVVWDLLLQARPVGGALPPSLEGATKAQRKAQERGS
jgi:hypothetical protein